MRKYRNHNKPRTNKSQIQLQGLSPIARIRDNKYGNIQQLKDQRPKDEKRDKHILLDFTKSEFKRINDCWIMQKKNPQEIMRMIILNECEKSEKAND